MTPVRLMSILGALLLAATAAAQGHGDTVHLKDGTSIRGTIVESVPDEWVRIRTSDGTVYVCDMVDVLRLTRDGVEVAKPARSQPTGPRLSPTEATLTSLGVGLLVDGGGQFINGEKLKAVGFATVSVVAWSMMSQGSDTNDDGLAAAGAGLRLASYVLAAAEANWSARRINKRRGHLAAADPSVNGIRLAANPSRRGRGGMLAFTHRM